MNTEPLRYVAAIVIGGKSRRPVQLYPRILIHADYRSACYRQKRSSADAYREDAVL